jgi:hypothetical protein
MVAIEAKSRVLRSERGGADELVDESRAFARTPTNPAATLAMQTSSTGADNPGRANLVSVTLLLNSSDPLGLSR